MSWNYVPKNSIIDRPHCGTKSYSNEKIFNTAIKISISKNGRSTRAFKVQFDRRIFLWVNGKHLGLL